MSHTLNLVIPLFEVLDDLDEFDAIGLIYDAINFGAEIIAFQVSDGEAYYYAACSEGTKTCLKWLYGGEDKLVADYGMSFGVSTHRAQDAMQRYQDESGVGTNEQLKKISSQDPGHFVRWVDKKVGRDS